MKMRKALLFTALSITGAVNIGVTFLYMESGVSVPFSMYIAGVVSGGIGYLTHKYSSILPVQNGETR